MAMEESSAMRSSSEKPSPFPKRPRVSFTTVSMRTFSSGEQDPKALSSPTERALSPIRDFSQAAEDSGEVTANVESLSRLVLEDELDARSKHLQMDEPSQLERVLLKQASPMRTPTAEQETSPLPENWDLYKQFKSSHAAAKDSPELKSTSHRISPRPGAFCAASLRPTGLAAPAPPLPARTARCSPRRSPDTTVDMSGVVRSIQMGPEDQNDSAVPEGRKSFATFQSFEPGPEIYAVKQASRRVQEPFIRSKAAQRYQHHRSDLKSSAERFREMRDQVIKEAEDDRLLMEQQNQQLKTSSNVEEQVILDLEEQVSSAKQSVEQTKEELRQAKKRLLRQKAQRVALQQLQAARSCFASNAAADWVELQMRGANATVKVNGQSATVTLRARNEDVTRFAWRASLAYVDVEKEEDTGSLKQAVLPVNQVPELLRHLDVALLELL